MNPDSMPEAACRPDAAIAAALAKAACELARVAETLRRIETLLQFVASATEASK